MNTPDTGLDIMSRRILAALLQQLEDNQLSGWRAVFAKTILWYYQSPLALIPDFIPGLGYVDYFCMSQLALWLCATDPDSIEKNYLDTFDVRCRKFLLEDDQPLLTTDTAKE